MESCPFLSSMRNYRKIGHRGSEVEVAGLGGLEGMTVDNIKRPVDRFVFPHCQGVIVLKSGRVLNMDWATDQIP